MVDFAKLFEKEAEEDTALKNYAARLPVYGVDPETGLTNYTNPVVPQLKLPVQGIHDQPYIPTQYDMKGPVEFLPSVRQGIRNTQAEQGSFEEVRNKLFGTGDVERTQLWPEKMVRSGASLPTDVMAGKILSGPGLRATDFSDIPGAPQPLSNLIERTQDLAGLAAGGSVAATGLKAERPGILARGAKTLKDRLTQSLLEDSEAGTGISSLAQRMNEHLNEVNRGNESMPEILARQRASEGYEAAIRDPETKKLYTGMWHEEVLDKIAKDKGIPKDQLPTNLKKGYVDYDGKFWTEQQIENKSRSKTAMFRSDNEAGTAIAAAKQSGNYIRMVPENYEPHTTDWYHGSSRIDRVTETGKIDPKRATSGPMPFFTDNPELASSYAKGKKVDTSLMKDDPGDSVHRYFTVEPKDLGVRSKKPITVEDSWNYLPIKKRQEILDKYNRIGYEDPAGAEGPYTLHDKHAGISSKDHYDYILKREAQGNPLKALRVLWHDGAMLMGHEGDLAEIYKLAGYPHKISEVNAPWVEAKGVLPAKLNIRNPLLTDQSEIILNKIVPKLEQAFEFDTSKKPAYSASDDWDKNYRFTPKEWVAQLKDDISKGVNSHVWSTIPDKITAELKKFGFDGIIDRSGKGGGPEHQVAIPFYPEQVRSRYAKNDPAKVGKSGLLLSDDIVGTGIAAVVSPRFYSHMENVVNDAKMMVRNAEGKRIEVPQEKFNSNELNAYLKNKGVSNEEIEALKISELLEGKKSVTKQELLNHLNENKVELNERWSGNHPKFNEIQEIDNRQRFITQRLKDIKDQIQSYGGGSSKAITETVRELIKEEKLLKEEIPTLRDRMNAIGENPNMKPRFAQYQLPGGSNYRELLLSLKDNPSKVKRIEEINSEIFNNEKEMVIARKNKDENKIKEISNKQGNLITEKRDFENAFTTDHWPGQKDVVVHNRMNDRFIPDEGGPSLTNINNSAYKGYSSYELGEGPLGGIALFGVKSNGEKIIVRQNFKNEIEAKAETEKLNKEIAVSTKGYNTLHSEEIQSDLHQKGNSEGYRLSLKDKNKLEPEFNRIEEKIVNSGDESVMSNPEIKDAIKSAVDKKIITEAEAKTYLRYADSERYGAVKDTSFKSTWSDLMIKRLIRQASEEGKDAISWTPGQAQVDRYPGLQEHYDRIEYNPETKRFKAYNKEGNLSVEKELDRSELVSHIGKETADKIINNPTRKIDYKIKQLDNGQYEVKDVNGKNRHFIDKHDAIDWVDKQGTNILDNADLKVGGEFHKKFYDEIMVNKVNAIAKKYGSRVEEKEIDSHKPSKDKWFGMVRRDNDFAVTVNDQIVHTAPTRQAADAWINEQQSLPAKQKIWFLKLTPELKKAALEKGFSLFETGLPLTPVSHDPFKSENKKYKLTPITGNPFK